MSAAPESNRFGTLLAGLESLWARPWCLYGIILALDALVQPYVGVVHDAQLYAVQVLNRVEGGRFNGDLFLHYGSQDSYSVFSLVMLPLARSLGVFPSFFLCYLASRALFLFGAMRLIGALVPDRRAAVTALVFLALNSISYGALDVFHVNERFLTPRLLAAGLALLGLERMLARRFPAAGGLLFLSFLLHPLIASGAALVLIFWCGFQFLPARIILAFLAAAASVTAVVLLYEPLGLKVFGYMDAEWRELVLRRNPHCFPAAWELADWLQIAGALLVLLGAARCLPRPLTHFCLAIALAGLVGTAASVLAAALPYALFLQGQPFRVLWLVQLLAIPCGFFIAFRWATAENPAWRFLGLILGVTVVYQFVPDQRSICILLASWSGCVLWFRFVAREADWPRLSSIAGIVIALFLGFVLSTAAIAQAWTDMLEELGPLHVAGSIGVLLDKALLLVVAVLLARRAPRWLGTTPHVGTLAVCLALAYQTVAFGIGESEWYRRAFRTDYANAEFVREAIAGASASARQPTVYWATEINNLWQHLRVNCYYHLTQTPNNIFSRGEAFEGDRRARLVARFELGRLRSLRQPGKERLSDAEWKLLLPNFYADGQEPLPDQTDLERLLRDPDLDYVVSGSFLGSDYCATNGKVFVYSARQACSAPKTRRHDNPE